MTPPPPMREAPKPRGRRKAAPMPEYREVVEPVRGVRVISILKPVWLVTHKARPGEVASVDVELADRLIAGGFARAYGPDI